MGLVFPEKGGTYMTVAYGNLLVAGPYGFPPARERREAGPYGFPLARERREPARERRENEKGLLIA